MNVREAILKAADSISREPERFSFIVPHKPEPGCGSPGCALGWIGAHFGIETKGEYHDYALAVAAKVLGFPQPRQLHLAHPFYARMAELDWCWSNSADACARALRLYADKYHPAEKRGMPDSVRAIFETKQEQVA